MSAFADPRDDGPLARALGRLAGAGTGGMAPSLPAALGVAGLLACVAALDVCADPALAGVGIGWLVALAGLSAGGAAQRDRFGWALPALLRAGEYTAVLWLAGAAGDAAAGFALLLALTLRHYDLFHRPRLRGVAPPAWLSVAAGGWDGRLVVVYALLVAGALPAGLYALAAALGALFVLEAAASARATGARADLGADPQGELP